MTDQDFRPRLIVLAGPNGAGKSTFHDVFLASLGFPFVNADLIAKALFGNAAADHALAAARLAHEERLALMERRESFIMETVFSDTGGHKLAFFRNARVSGYVIEAHFIGLSSWKRSRARVAQRVRQGGHDVPDGHLEARYPRTLNNLALLTGVADRLFIYDNSNAERPYALVATFGAGLLLSLRDPVPPWIGPLALDDRISVRTRRFTG